MCTRGQNKLERHELPYEEDTQSDIPCYSNDFVFTGGCNIFCVAYPTGLGWQYHYDYKCVLDSEPGSRLGENIHRVQ